MKSASVLVIDDEENLRKLLSRVIELGGCNVLSGAAAKTACDYFKKENITAVISDVRLPDINGDDLVSTNQKRFYCSHRLHHDRISSD